MTARLAKLVGPHDAAIEARGRGLLRGLAVKGNPAQIVGKCRERGVLLSVAGANVIRFAPPRAGRKKHIDEAGEVLAEVLAGVS